MGNTVGIPIARVILDDFEGPFWGKVHVLEIAGVQGGVSGLEIDDYTTVLVGCRGYVFPDLNHTSGSYYLPEIVHVRAGVVVRRGSAARMEVG